MEKVGLQCRCSFIQVSAKIRIVLCFDLVLRVEANEEVRKRRGNEGELSRGRRVINFSFCPLSLLFFML